MNCSNHTILSFLYRKTYSASTFCQFRETRTAAVAGIQGSLWETRDTWHGWINTFKINNDSQQGCSWNNTDLKGYNQNFTRENLESLDKRNLIVSDTKWIMSETIINWYCYKCLYPDLFLVYCGWDFISSWLLFLDILYAYIYSTSSKGIFVLLFISEEFILHIFY